MKTKLKDGMIMYAVDTNNRFMFCIEIQDSKLRYIYKLDNSVYVVTDDLKPPNNISNNEIHKITIQRPDPNYDQLIVDNKVTFSKNSPISTGSKKPPNDTDLEIESEIYIGGIPGKMYAVIPDKISSRDGYQGCVFSIDIDANTWPMLRDGIELDEMFHDDVIGTCLEESKSSKEVDCPCKNGGMCSNDDDDDDDDDDSSDVICNCTMTSLRGPLCDDDSPAFEFQHPESTFKFAYPQHSKPNTFIDVVVFGIITRQTNVAFLTISSEPNTDIIVFYMLRGHLNVDVVLEKKNYTIRSTRAVISDGMYHIVRFNRTGSTMRLQIDSDPTIIENRSAHKLEMFRNQAIIFVGGRFFDNRFGSSFSGIIAGLYVNGLFLFDPTNQNQNNFEITVSRKTGFNRHDYTHRGDELHHWETSTTKKPRKVTYPSVSNKIVKPVQDELIRAKLDVTSCPVFEEHLLDICGVEANDDTDDSFIRPTIEIKRLSSLMPEPKLNEVTIQPTVQLDCDGVTCSSTQHIPDLTDSKEMDTNIFQRFDNSTPDSEHIPDGGGYKIDNYDNPYHHQLYQQKTYSVRYGEKTVDYNRYMDRYDNDTDFHNYYTDNPDYVVSSILTNIILTIGISISFIILVLVLLYAIKKCSQTKGKENETLDQLVPELRYNQHIPKTNSMVTSNTHIRQAPETMESLLRNKPISETYVKEWFI